LRCYTQVHENYENLEASKHNLWVECEQYKKSLKFSNGKLEQYENLKKQPQDVVTLHQEIEFLRETLSKFVGSIEKLNKMLRYNKFPTDKSGNGYKGKKYVCDEEIIVCCFCGKVGKISIDLYPLIDNVCFVKGLKHHLLNISLICDSGLNVSFSKEGCVVQDKNRTQLFTTKRKGNLYKINLSELSNQNVTCLISIKGNRWVL